MIPTQCPVAWNTYPVSSGVSIPLYLGLWSQLWSSHTVFQYFLHGICIVSMAISYYHYSDSVSKSQVHAVTNQMERIMNRVSGCWQILFRPLDAKHSYCSPEDL